MVEPTVLKGQIPQRTDKTSRASSKLLQGLQIDYRIFNLCFILVCPHF